MRKSIVVLELAVFPEIRRPLSTVRVEVGLANHAGSEPLDYGLLLSLEKPKSASHHDRLLTIFKVIYTRNPMATIEKAKANSSAWWTAEQ